MYWLPYRLTQRIPPTRRAPDGIESPISVREVEDRIPTIDEQGSLRIVIRTRTLARFDSPAGAVEIEQARRYTLPSFGHVYPVTHNEYVVFRGRMKLRGITEKALASASLAINAVRDYKQEADDAELSLRSIPLQVSPHRNTRTVFAGLIVALITLAVWKPLQDQAATSSALTPMADYTQIILMANKPQAAPFATMLLPGGKRIEATNEASLAHDNDLPARGKVARVAFAIRPWGVVYVNGKKRGTSPPISELRLKSGRYTVEVRNEAHAAYKETIDLRTKATAKVTHDFLKADTAVAKIDPQNLVVMARSPTRFLSEEWPR